MIRVTVTAVTHLFPVEHSLEHFYQRSYTSEVKFDITSQITNQHEVKFGVKGKWDTMDFVFFEVLRNRSQLFNSNNSKSC